MGLDNGIRSWLAIGSKASTKKYKTIPLEVDCQIAVLKETAWGVQPNVVS